MGVDYFNCEVCGTIFDDAGDYGNCGDCDAWLCVKCNDKMVEKYGSVYDRKEKDYDELEEDIDEDEDEDNYIPNHCDKCQKLGLDKEKFQKFMYFAIKEIKRDSLVEWLEGRDLTLEDFDMMAYYFEETYDIDITKPK